MANPYPLQNTGPTQYTGKSPSAVTDEAQRYRDMLGFQSAGADNGLFGQLNAIAREREEQTQANGTVPTTK